MSESTEPITPRRWLKGRASHQALAAQHRDAGTITQPPVATRPSTITRPDTAPAPARSDSNPGDSEEHIQALPQVPDFHQSLPASPATVKTPRARRGKDAKEDFVKTPPPPKIKHRRHSFRDYSPSRPSSSRRIDHSTLPKNEDFQRNELASKGKEKSPYKQAISMKLTSVGPVRSNVPLIAKQTLAEAAMGEWMYKDSHRPSTYRGCSVTPRATYENQPLDGQPERLHVRSSVRPQKRWVWLAPFEKKIMWDSDRPLGLGHRTRELSVNSVMEVKCDYAVTGCMFPHISSNYSILVLTPRRAIRLTAMNHRSHEMWLAALRFVADAPADVDSTSWTNIIRDTFTTSRPKPDRGLEDKSNPPTHRRRHTRARDLVEDIRSRSRSRRHDGRRHSKPLPAVPVPAPYAMLPPAVPRFPTTATTSDEPEPTPKTPSSFGRRRAQRRDSSTTTSNNAISPHPPSLAKRTEHNPKFDHYGSPPPTSASRVPTSKSEWSAPRSRGRGGTGGGGGGAVAEKEKEKPPTAVTGFEIDSMEMMIDTLGFGDARF